MLLKKCICISTIAYLSVNYYLYYYYYYCNNYNCYYYNLQLLQPHKHNHHQKVKRKIGECKERERAQRKLVDLEPSNFTHSRSR